MKKNPINTSDSSLVAPVPSTSVDATSSKAAIRPTDYEFCLMSTTAYRTLAQITATEGARESFDEKLKPWHVYQHYCKDHNQPQWEYYLDKQSHSKNHQAGFSASAFLNSEKKALVIAFRGTDNLDGWAQDGASIVGQLSMNTQQSEAYRFILATLEKLLKDPDIRDELKAGITANYRNYTEPKRPPLTEFQLYFTGHSLGAWLAAYFGVIFNVPMVLFESPGTLPALEHAQETRRESKIDYQQLDITVYYGRPDLFNTMNPEIPGRTFQVFPRLGSTEAQKKGFFAHTKENHSIVNILEQFSPETGLPDVMVQVMQWPHNASTPGDSLWRRLKTLAKEEIGVKVGKDKIATWFADRLENTVLLATVADQLKASISGYAQVTLGNKAAMSPPTVPLSPIETTQTWGAGYEVRPYIANKLPLRYLHPDVVSFLQGFNETRELLVDKPVFLSLPLAAQSLLSSCRLLTESTTSLTYLEYQGSETLSLLTIRETLTQIVVKYTDLVEEATLATQVNQLKNHFSEEVRQIKALLVNRQWAVVLQDTHNPDHNFVLTHRQLLQEIAHAYQGDFSKLNDEQILAPLIQQEKQKLIEDYALKTLHQLRKKLVSTDTLPTLYLQHASKKGSKWDALTTQLKQHLSEQLGLTVFDHQSDEAMTACSHFIFLYSPTLESAYRNNKEEIKQGCDLFKSQFAKNKQKNVFMMIFENESADKLTKFKEKNEISIQDSQMIWLESEVDHFKYLFELVTKLLPVRVYPFVEDYIQDFNQQMDAILDDTPDHVFKVMVLEGCQLKQEGRAIRANTTVSLALECMHLQANKIQRTRQIAQERPGNIRHADYQLQSSSSSQSARIEEAQPTPTLSKLDKGKQKEAPKVAEKAGEEFVPQN